MNAPLESTDVRVSLDSEKKGDAGDGPAFILKGTTLDVYRFIFREGRPVGPHDIQRGLGLRSASLASYHLSKLQEAGLIRESEQGYVVDRTVFENVIRVRRLLIPAEAGYVAFLGTAIPVLLTVLRPPVFYPSYYFSMIVLLVALLIVALETKRVTSRKV
jgi:DNA-binding transcriptional ArsR family regulator